MSKDNVSSIPLTEFPLWDKVRIKRVPSAFSMEITARCNNNCRHCYINLPAGDEAAKKDEMSLQQIKDIVDEAVSLGALWCLVTGGEPFLRDDFSDIYLYLKRKGLLLSIFTNAALITKEHVALFRKYPPRDIEVSVYGVTEETYERVTRRRGSFASFMKGFDLLIESGVKVRLKAMALRSNVHEMPEIARFCRQKTKDFFRFDPFLHLRYDGDLVRNEEIISERLSPEEIITLERSDPERYQALEQACDKRIVPEASNTTDDHVFCCGTGTCSFHLSYNGLFRPCSSLCHPDCVYDLSKGSLTDAWRKFVPRVRSIRSKRKEFAENCRSCELINLCLWCPAHAYLETGELDAMVDYFCQVAHARVEAVTET